MSACNRTHDHRHVTGMTTRSILWLFVVLATVTSVLAACQSANPNQPAPSDGTAATGGTTAPAGGTNVPAGGAGVAEARAAIDAANVDDPASLQAIDGIRFTDEGAAAAAQALQAGATDDALWAATFVYGTSGSDPTVLGPAMKSDDPTVRAMAAAAVLSLGQADAARVLVALLVEDGNVRGSTPPVGIAGFALSSLARYIDGPSVPATTAPKDAAASWTSWLDAHEATMQFDTETGRWRAP
jgi:hypothetical protein